MNLKKLYFLGVFTLLASTSCSKIDNFDVPHMLEGFSGAVKVTPGIEGITAKQYAVGLVFFNSNKDGTEVVMYGPGTENFSLYSLVPEGDDGKDEKTGLTFRKYMSDFQHISKLDKLDFSGFRGHVNSDGKSITFYDFGDQSDGMRKFKWEVKGFGIIDGPDSHIRITISTKVKILQDMLPTGILQQLGAPNSDQNLAEFEGKETVVYLAQIEVLGEALTLGY